VKQTDKVMAHDKAGKEEAEQRKDVKESQAKQAKEQKKLDNLNEKHANKQDINVRHEVGKDAAAKAYNEGYENPENKAAGEIFIIPTIENSFLIIYANHVVCASLNYSSVWWFCK
jgi:hypothetical protein